MDDPSERVDKPVYDLLDNLRFSPGSPTGLPTLRPQTIDMIDCYRMNISLMELADTPFWYLANR